MVNTLFTNRVYSHRCGRGFPGGFEMLIMLTALLAQDSNRPAIDYVGAALNAVQIAELL